MARLKFANSLNKLCKYPIVIGKELAPFKNIVLFEIRQVVFEIALF